MRQSVLFSDGLISTKFNLSVICLKSIAQAAVRYSSDSGIRLAFRNLTKVHVPEDENKIKALYHMIKAIKHRKIDPEAGTETAKQFACVIYLWNIYYTVSLQHDANINLVLNYAVSLHLTRKG